MFENENELRSVDLKFALQQRKKLTPEEFCLTFPNEDYSEYTKQYYKLKIPRFFEKYSTSKWFIEKFGKNTEKKYLIQENFKDFKNLKDFPVLSIDSEIKNRFKDLKGDYLILNKISPEYGWEDFSYFFSKIEGIREFDITKTSYASNYDRKVIAKLSDNFNKEEIQNEMNKILPNQNKVFITISDEIIKNTISLDVIDQDLINCRKLLKILNSQFGTEILFDTSNLDEFIIFLRFVFNYCYYCSKLYDTEIEMLYDCGDYHVRDKNVKREIFDRKYKINLMKRDLSFLFNQNIEKELEKFIIITDMKEYKCDLCSQNFKDDQIAKKHIFDEHAAFCKDLEIKHENLQNFIKKIDFNIFSFFDGTDNNFLPMFSVHEKEGRAVKYDLPRIYKGELNIEE